MSRSQAPIFPGYGSSRGATTSRGQGVALRLFPKSQFLYGCDQEFPETGHWSGWGNWGDFPKEDRGVKLPPWKPGRRESRSAGFQWSRRSTSMTSDPTLISSSVTSRASPCNLYRESHHYRKLTCPISTVMTSAESETSQETTPPRVCTVKAFVSTLLESLR